MSLQDGVSNPTSLPNLFLSAITLQFLGVGIVKLNSKFSVGVTEFIFLLIMTWGYFTSSEINIYN